MKTALILCALTTAAFAESPVLMKVTADDITKLQQTSPMTHLKQPAKDEAPVTRSAEQSIIKQSTILHDGFNWTLVPNGAVIFVPPAMRGHLDAKPVGTLLAWVDFLANNRSWITTSDTSIDQATGKKPIPAERTAFWAKQDKIVIAVHQGGPISVRVASETLNLTQR